MPTIVEVIVWVNNRSSAMFLMNCKYISLIKLQEYTHTYSYLWKYSMVSRTNVENPGSPLNRIRNTSQGVPYSEIRGSIVVESWYDNVVPSQRSPPTCGVTCESLVSPKVAEREQHYKS